MQVVVWPEEGFFQTSHDVLVCIRNQGGRSTCFFCDAFILIIIGLFYCYWWCSRISLGNEEPDQILFIASKKFFFKTAAPLLTLWKSSFGQSPIR